MSDWYQAIIDLHAQADDAEHLALKFVATLMNEGLIQPNRAESQDCADQCSYKAGPRFNEYFGATSQTGILQTYARGWYSEYGAVGLESATCSICGTKISNRTQDELIQLKTLFAEAGQTFCRKGILSTVSCPFCTAEISANLWQTLPHLGFSRLAFVFWNWPPFEDCRFDLQDYIDGIIGHKTVLTYGHL